MDPLSAATIIGGIVVCWIVKKCLDELYDWARPNIVRKTKRPKRYQIMFF